ncbi:chorismate-binding protein [Lutibacter sp.]|uniref:chorismate-binding protein n=1 Tax=Lutibacter sp. TaxID=1925666 RepID=UPI003568A6EF
MNTDTAHFFSTMEGVLNSKLPFVAYRKPDEETVKAFVQRTKELRELKSYNEAAFVFAPFCSKGKKVIFPYELCNYFSASIRDADLLESDEMEKEQPQFMAFEELSDLKEKHMSLVQKSIDFIKTKEAKKIVLSRKETLQYGNLNVLNTFKKMLKIYKNAFVYLWFHPEIGLWMGATPEKLLTSFEGNFKTMALAGTQKYNGTTNVNWQIKEKKEQQYVTEFILENLKESVEKLEVTEPFTVQAGSLVHIRTDISGKLKLTNSLEKLINALHPTPAVCGLPKAVAEAFILQNENYERSYYSGYLGELNLNEGTSLFVNLRCVQLENNLASIYVGGGITADSIPGNEWEETVSKAEVMKKVLS